MQKRRTRKTAIALRKQMTDAESRLWHFLRRRQLNGCKFRRQHPVGPFIADFACLEAGLIIEVDGGQHAERIAEDDQRTRYLNSCGFKVLRFWNNEVLKETASCLDVIADALASTPTPALPRKRGRENEVAGKPGGSQSSPAMTDGE
ncbi:MAG: hypothetical protein CVV18_02225 [Gammaproteobacteria bacterium HGW-Gammaproteobacteria-8]|nr:MAG: hypothetical protein CVV18_02225 [Gammaproteobacteria bacterium HGW-Gammaproteobacteria-8]